MKISSLEVIPGVLKSSANIAGKGTQYPCFRAHICSPILMQRAKHPNNNAALYFVISFFILVPPFLPQSLISHKTTTFRHFLLADHSASL